MTTIRIALNTIRAAFDDAMRADATDSTIDDAIADIAELLDDNLIDDKTADDLISALHRIAELPHIEI